MFSAFISYSTKNLEQAQRVRDELKHSQVNVFLAKDSFRIGDAVTPTIMKEIEQCDVFLLLWSEEAAASKWVRDEVKTAVSSHKHILPVKLDDTALPEMLGDIHYVSEPADGNRALEQIRTAVFERADNKNYKELAMILVICFGAVWALSGKSV